MAAGSTRARGDVAMSMVTERGNCASGDAVKVKWIGSWAGSGNSGVQGFFKNSELGS